jgi:hypothetical protein
MSLMMINPGLLSLFVLAAIHLFANRPAILGWIWRGPFLSFASGVSLSYVFVDLLPALERGEPVLKRSFDQIIPYLELHTYLIALLGILFYYGVQSRTSLQKHPWLPVSGYLLFNFFVGASLSDSSNPEIQPLALFTIAIGLHYFIRDHLAKIPKKRLILWSLISILFAGYLTGYLIRIPDTATAIGISFVSGGILLNTFQYELPKKEKGGYLWFICGALLYATILLSLGEVKLHT